MTAETSNARGDVVAWFPTNGRGEIIRTYGDGSPVYACRTKEEAEQAKRCHLGATGPVIPLYAAPPPADAEPKPVLSEPDRIGLYQGPDDCPQLMVNDRPVAIFPAGSWAKVCDALDSITGSVQPEPKAEARGVVDDRIESILHKLNEWSRAYPEDIFREPSKDEREWLHATKPGLMDRVSASMGRHMVRLIRDDLRALTAALTEARNG